MTDFDRDPAALAWARAKVQESVDRAELASINDTFGPITRDKWAQIAAYMRRELIAREGVTHAAFDERWPVTLAAIDPQRQTEPQHAMAALTKPLSDAVTALMAGAQSIARELARIADIQQSRYALAPPPVELEPVEHVLTSACETPESHNWGCPCGPSVAEQLHAAEERAERAEAGRLAADKMLRGVCEVFGGPHQDPVVKARETLARAERAEADRDDLLRQRTEKAEKYSEYIERATTAEAERDGAYRERAQLLADDATTYPAVLAPATDLNEPGWWLLFITRPTGQGSWHIHPRDLDLFAHVEPVAADDPRAQWDGHTTEQKYERIAEHVRRAAQTTEG